MKYDPGQILIIYRARAGEKSIDLIHDFTDIPAKDDLEGEFGPGLYTLYIKETEDTHPETRKRYTIDGYPTVLVESHEIKMGISEEGKLLDTDPRFPAGKPPAREEIITAPGGGG